MKKNNRLEPEDSICEMASYEQQYLKPIEIDRRQCVYISKRNHGILTSLIRSINQKGLTVGGYIDNHRTPGETQGGDQSPLPPRTQRFIINH